MTPDAPAPGGLVLVFTGDGKGKTTAALGQALRAVGHGLAVRVVQFIKARACGEHAAAERLAPALVIERLGRGFVVPGAPAGEADAHAAARAALDRCRTLLADGACDLLVADEVLTAARLGLLDEADVLALLEARPAPVHLVLTGRGATEAVRDRADLVTEMRLVKHPHQRGEPARPGIEY